jgi:hypothetical protein
MTHDGTLRPEPEPSVDELRRQQRAETSGSGLGTPGQWHGAIGGAVIGAIVGGIVMLAVALVAFRAGPGLVVLPAVGVAFGAVVGLVYEGGRNPEREEELLTADGAPDRSTAVAGNPPEADEQREQDGSA